MLRVLNTLNGRCAARPKRGVSSPVERLIGACLHGATMATYDHRKEVDDFSHTACFLCIASRHPPDISETMHVSERST